MRNSCSPSGDLLVPKRPIFKSFSDCQKTFFRICGYLVPMAKSWKRKELVDIRWWQNDQIVKSFSDFWKLILDFWIFRSGGDISEAKRATGNLLVAERPDVSELFRFWKTNKIFSFLSIYGFQDYIYRAYELALQHCAYHLHLMIVPCPQYLRGCCW